MAETDVHRDQMTYLIEALKTYFRDDPEVYVAGNLFIYYGQGYPYERVAPDVFVVFGVPKKKRRIYKLWEEEKAPDVVIEVSSRGTREVDMWKKRGLFESLGVREYFLFDPLEEYLTPPLQGFSMGKGNGSYRPLLAKAGTDGEWKLYSNALGLELRTEDGFLRLCDPATGEKLPTYSEAEQRARQEAELRRKSEQRIAELEVELARLRSEK